jgi:hypothetical protein
MALYEGKTDLRSEYSFVPNQALYQAEPQPEKKSLLWQTRQTRHLLRVFCGKWQGNRTTLVSSAEIN